MNKTVFVLLLIGIAAIPANAADDEKPGAGLPRVALMDVLNAASKSANLTFVVDEGAQPDVVIGQLGLANLGYAELLLILRNNDLAAVRAGQLINIVPVATVRQHALPVVRGGNRSMEDEEWVTWIVSVKHMDATNFVPILRPLLPQAGHLAASSASGTLIIVDRYANAKRIAAIIADLDNETRPEYRSN